jgi:hypothetical protein
VPAPKTPLRSLLGTLVRPWRLLPVLLAVVPAALFAAVVQKRTQRELLLPGPTSSGHHQIESKCEGCHKPFGGVAEDACLKCHGAALTAQNDSHAVDKFTDPGRAPMLAHIDARSCLPCHREHRPEGRQRGSVTVAQDFCFPCHAEVRSQRPSHRDLAATSCADVGCHNYHDNRALYGELLVKHRDEPATRARGALPLLTAFAVATVGETPGTAPVRRPLGEAQANVASLLAGQEEVAGATRAWAESAHARAGVNCSGCHGKEVTRADFGNWKVPMQTCAGCHEPEQNGFLAGKHGMRLAQELTAMRPAQARLPMRPSAHGRELGCNTCHAAHAYDTAAAAVEACESCHADRHTRAYRGSAHFALWQAERTGEGRPGSGVSCATCHLPRRPAGTGGKAVAAVHNQNDNLRPPDRMARDVCGHCHGLAFSLQALADPAAGNWNYYGPPGPVRTAMDLVKGATGK